MRINIKLFFSIFGLLFIVSTPSCYFLLDRDNSNDPKSGSFDVLPDPDFIASVTEGYARLTVDFTDTSLGHEISSWEWDFDNDGTVDSTERNPSHTYDLAGTYTVSLTAVNVNGQNEIVKEGLITVTIGPAIKHTVTTTYSNGYAIHANDIDNDGDMDVIGVSSTTGKQVVWWENSTGDGLAWTERIVYSGSSSSYSVYTADIDDDGHVDIASALSTEDQIAYWKNDGTPLDTPSVDNWSKVPVSSFDNPYHVNIADIDNDDDLDIIAVATTGASAAPYAAWWENNGSWTEHSLEDTSTVFMSLFTGYINNDGHIDVLASTTSTVSWYESGGDGDSWTNHTIETGLVDVRAVIAVDIDNDGDLDVVSALSTANKIIFWENINGNGTFGEKRNITDSFPEPNSVTAADIDGDGDIDIAATANNDKVAWWENTDGAGGAWTERQIADNLSLACAIYSADIDGDGDTEVVALGYNGEIAWWDIIR